MTTDLPHHTLAQLRDAIARRELSAVECARAYLDRIERLDPDLGAYHELYRDRALDRAAAVDRGQVTGPLAGVPIAIKDNLCTDWGRTTCSSRMLEHFRAPYTATAVRRLEAAGAVILGKTNLDEFAMGSSTENCALGSVRNPWHPDYVPGGSSGGSAAAVAADLCAGALGSDTGGSIRQPAALCGVTGIKPTYGRVSRYGLVAFASSLDQIGTFARTVRDATLLLDAITGHDPHDSTSAPAPAPGGVPTRGVSPSPSSATPEADLAPQLDLPVRGMKVGIARQYLSDANDPAVAAAVDRSIAALGEQGVEIVEVDLPHTHYGIPCYYLVCTAEASSNLARYDGVHYGHRTARTPDDLADLYARSRAEGFGPEVKRRIMLGTYALSSGYYDAYYLRALKVRRLIKNDFDAAFARCQAILCPTTTGPAFPRGQKSDDPVAMYLNDVYTVNCNLAGIPGVSVPAGFAQLARPDGKTVRLPVGVQLLGPAFGEADMLRLAHAIDRSLAASLERPVA